ncbi:hypothetical protein ESOMN_v1c04610 [Williamsoniiplasma somnilux]|uniref:ECF transporter S component n=1 Tax=Williamsoniiplasma somnilux TaxID=215578 RepID=A0A2K8P1Q7_9MOLU|nr:ECF transporter S component [Williamsoniiplasma somnilux]ATZ18843.1 hypothetical protein ESOMN_v1c04610 [Williamsoniiplasma somnilux]
MKKPKNAQETLKKLKKDLIIDLKDEQEVLKENHRKEDHYHGYHHFDKFGNHDDISEDEFKITTMLKISSKSLIYRLVLTGVFLALAIVASAMDMLTESLAIPIGQVYIQTRFLDTIVMLLALPAIGPIFALLLAIIEPILHNLIHGMEHGWIQPFMDSLSNSLIILLSWVLYYYVFKNSPYHKHPSKKVDLYRRITPAIILVLVAALISTGTFILALKIQDLTTNVNLLPEETISFDHISSEFALIFFSIFGVNILRYGIAYAFYVLIEGRIRPLNHRYK